eukprot:Gb_07906 [translate_table: standard]
MENYEKLEKIGEGTYGKVYKALDKRTGQIVALKKARVEADQAGLPPTAVREVSILKTLCKDCPHIVRLLGVVRFRTVSGKCGIYLVFEYMNVDLKMYIEPYARKSEHIPDKTIKSFMYQLFKGIAHCHSRGVLHRDIKPNNILVDTEKGLLKIADLGLGRVITIPLKTYTHEIVTLWYRPPEVLLGDTHYSTAVDIWPAGCIFAELCNSHPLFTGDSELQQLLQIFYLLGTPNEHVWPGVTTLKDWHVYPQWRPGSLSKQVPTLDSTGLDLLSKTLIYEPSKRISAKKAMRHAYFKDLDRSTFS